MEMVAFMDPMIFLESILVTNWVQACLFFGPLFKFIERKPMKSIAFDTVASTHAGKQLHAFIADVLGKKTFYVLVHAPWCGACLALKPSLQKALRKVESGSSSPVLVKVSDQVYNHYVGSQPNEPTGKLLTSMQLRGYPTIARVSSSPKHRVIHVDIYQGDRSIESLVDFLSN